MIDEVASDGDGFCKYVRYTSNGEALIHPQFINMVSYAGKHLKSTAINVTTNGKVLNAKRANALLDAGVQVFDVSIDAFEADTYAKIRVKGDLEVTRQNVLNLIDTINSKGYATKVVVSFVEQKLNTSETDAFEKFWKKAGASYVVIRRLHSCAGAKGKIAEAMKENEKEERYPCLYPWERLVLSPTGQLGFCPADWTYSSKIAYLQVATIKEIWQGEFMKKLRQAHLSNDYSNHSFCGQCPDWASTRWPFHGRAYSSMMHELVPEDLI